MRTFISMKSMTTIPRAVLMLLFTGGALTTAGVAADVESDYVLESRLLENELDRYVETRERENQAIQEVRSASSRLDDTLADPPKPISQSTRR